MLENKRLAPDQTRKGFLKKSLPHAETGSNFRFSREDHFRLITLFGQEIMHEEREYLVGWCFSVQGNEFMCDFFNDDTCEFYSWKDRNNQGKADKDIFIKAFVGDKKSQRQLENHQREFSITAHDIESQLILDIIELDKKLKEEGDITPQEEKDIDSRIEPYFWEQVNPYLSSSLTK